MICSGCGREIPNDSVFCPFCGATNKAKNKRITINWWLLLSATLFILIVFLSFYALDQYHDMQWNLQRYQQIMNDEGVSRTFSKKRYEWFMDNVQVVQKGSNVYHKINCAELENKSIWTDNSFSMYDAKTASKKGYHKCSKCH